MVFPASPAAIPLCFGIAFVLSRVADRFSKRGMSSLVRAIFTYALGFFLLEVVGSLLIVAR